jgi:hypothetical protein
MPIHFEITFAAKDDSCEERFRWIPRTTKLSEKWLNLLIFSLENPYTIREQNFRGWSHSPQKKIALIAELNATIATICKELNGKYTIEPLGQSPQLDQEKLNELHVHFETLMGKNWAPSAYLDGLSIAGINAIRDLNELIHHYENMVQTEKTFAQEGEFFGGFQFQLYPFGLQELTDEDLQTFTLAQEMGDLVTPYCQLGKHWLEVYYDQDERIGTANISPLRYFGPNGYCRFYRKSEGQAQQEMNEVLEFAKQYSAKRKMAFPESPHKLAIGHSPLASLEEVSPILRWSSLERAKFFEEFDSISQLEVKIGAQKWQRRFPQRRSYFVESEFSPAALELPTLAQIHAARFDPRNPLR